LLFGQFRRDQIRLDSISVYAVIDFCEIPFNVPTELFALFLFEALEFLYQIKLEFYRYPGSELKGDILVPIGSAVSARL
jgi:hypothetical protein